MTAISKANQECMLSSLCVISGQSKLRNVVFGSQGPGPLSHRIEATQNVTGSKVDILKSGVGYLCAWPQRQ